MFLHFNRTIKIPTVRLTDWPRHDTIQCQYSSDAVVPMSDGHDWGGLGLRAQDAQEQAASRLA